MAGHLKCIAKRCLKPFRGQKGVQVNPRPVGRGGGGGVQEG